MRPFLRRLAGREVLLFLVVISGGAIGLAGDSATVAARQYSTYSDPDKPVISVILSEESNVEEFQTEFGLSDEQIREVLAIVREENEILAREYAESEQIVEANEELRSELVQSRIAASDYDERVRAAIAETKANIEALLPEDRRTDLAAWVDAKFAQEDQEASEDDALTTDEVTSAGRRAVRCKVFATQYHGFTRREVALPHRILKEKGGFSVRIRRGKHRTTAKVKEVGPWNLRDNYWQSRKYRDMWDNLPRCKPEAEAAYFDNYNKGKDQFGRKVRNPAGVDLTPRVARTLGLKKYQNAWVYVTYPWAKR
jgi:hypothetical protein